MSTQTENPNILLCIGDDLGHDVVNITGTGTTRAMEVHTNDGAVDIYGALANISRSFGMVCISGKPGRSLAARRPARQFIRGYIRGRAAWAARWERRS